MRVEKKFCGGYFLDIKFELGKHKFIWDNEKAKINKKKHGINFETAAEVFLDENRIDDYDELHSNFEDRTRVIGMVEEILTVIYTERGDRNRIISARKASKTEKEDYYEQFYY